MLGGLVGWERERIGQSAGMRTHALVAFGAALFTVLSLHAFPGGDPARVASQILTGIGFIGAGTILHKQNAVHGLTTAAGLWAAAAVGMAVGVGWYWHAVIAAVIIAVILFLHDGKRDQPTA